MTRLLLRAGGDLLIVMQLALLLSLSLGRVQAAESPMLAYLGRFRGTTHIYLLTYLLDVSRQQSVRLSEPSPMDGHFLAPVWSPDGRFLVYGDWLHNLPLMAVLDLHTSQIHVLDDYSSLNPVWRQTGTAQLVYASPSAKALQAFDPLTKETIRLMDYPLDSRTESQMIWSQSRNELLMVSRQSGNQEIYRLNPEDSTMLNLTNHPGEDFQPAWSPDGQWVAFTSDRNRRNYEIYVVDRNGENMRNITRSISEDWNPVWSPDGVTLAFVGSIYGNYQIYSFDMERRLTRNLTQTNHSELSPAWSPDGKHIAFVSNRDGWRQIYLMDADGKNQRPLVTGAAEYFAPVWRPISPPALVAD